MNREKAKLVQMEVCATAKAMADQGLTAGTWGNIAGRIDDTYMVITPSGMDYSKLVPENMVIVNMNTLEYEGDLKPSIEVPVHAKLLLTRPEVNGVVHVHSSKALAVAVTRKGIPSICDDQVQILGGDIRCAGYATPGTPEVGIHAAKALEGRGGCTLANHGVLAVGKDLSQAYLNAEYIEDMAKIYILAKQVGQPVVLPGL